MRRPLACLVLLAACDSAPPPRAAQPTVDTVSPSEPVEQPQPEQPADSPAVTLTEHGYGPLRVGMNLDQARAALGGDLRLDDQIGRDEGPDACRYAQSGRIPGWIMIEGERVVRVDADSTVATAAGVRIGDSEARVRATYPLLREELHAYVEGHYLIVLPGAPADTLHRLVFETDGSRVTDMRGGLYPHVEYVEGCS